MSMPSSSDAPTSGSIIVSAAALFITAFWSAHIMWLGVIPSLRVRRCTAVQLPAVAHTHTHTPCLLACLLACLYISRCLFACLISSTRCGADGADNGHCGVISTAHAARSRVTSADEKTVLIRPADTGEHVSAAAPFITAVCSAHIMWLGVIPSLRFRRCTAVQLPAVAHTHTHTVFARLSACMPLY